MLIKLLCVVVIVGACVGEYVGDDEYVDAVLDMLLNGVSKEFEQSDDNDSGEVPVLTGGIWKCGRCDDIDETRLIYSEVNEVDADTLTDESLDIQILLFTQMWRASCVESRAHVVGSLSRSAWRPRSISLYKFIASFQKGRPLLNIDLLIDWNVFS